MKSCALAPGFASEVDALDEADWCHVLGQFDDANIYQTWTYDEVRAGRKHISQLILKKNNEVVSAAQARILKVPILNAGIAYVRWGPIWRRRGQIPSTEVFRQAIRALRNEYVCRRGLTLRVYPAVFREDSVAYADILTEEDFTFVKNDKTDRTLILDLSHSLEDLRGGLTPHWHRELRIAEKNKLEVIEGTDDHIFELFIRIYREMVGRKHFSEPNDINEFKSMQKALPERFKMRVMICKSGAEICAGHICSALGNSGVYLFGATSNNGLKSRGSYLLHWKTVEWLKSQRFASYDLNGINPLTNPGTYKFKSDLCGSNGRDVQFLGRFESRGSLLSYSSVACGDRLRSTYNRVRQFTRE